MKTKNVSVSFVEEEISINDSVYQMLDDYRHAQDDFFFSLEDSSENEILFHQLEMQAILASSTKMIHRIPCLI